MAELSMSSDDIERLAAPIAERVLDILADRFEALMPVQRNVGKSIIGREGIAELLEVSTATIDRWVKSGRIPSIGDSNTRRFIVADVIEAERIRGKRGSDD
jgi:hypothetical protein